jgi:hypothetical protein
MKCPVCEIGCDIAEGRSGRCRMYSASSHHSCNAPDPLFLAAAPAASVEPKAQADADLLQGCDVRHCNRCP